MIQPKTLPGFMELLPNEQVLFNKIKSTIEDTYKSYGFMPLDTPVIESSEVLLAKAGGETEKQIYAFNKGDNNLCLRFDLTVPLAKYVAQNFNELSFPFSRYQIGKVYRGEKPQKGRFREFYQCDIDVIGHNNLSMIYDAEIPSIIYNIFKKLDIGKFTIFISNRKILFGLLESIGLSNKAVDILRIVDKVDKIGNDKFKQCLKDDLNLNDQAIETLEKFISVKGSNNEQIEMLKNMNVENETFVKGVEELEQVVLNMRAFNVEEDYFAINLSIARGLDYYTGTVYETFITGYEKMGSVSSGGRYDNLAGFYSKEKLPGVGMSIGLTRLFDQLRINNLLKQDGSNVSKVIILPMGNTFEECIKLSNKLRQSLINTTLYLEDVKFKNKIAFATKSNIKYAILVGEDEIKSQNYTLKNLVEFKQEQLSLEEIINKLKSE